jgi:hypothetical protein
MIIRMICYVISKFINEPSYYQLIDFFDLFEHFKPKYSADFISVDLKNIRQSQECDCSNFTLLLFLILL